MKKTFSTQCKNPKTWHKRAEGVMNSVIWFEKKILTLVKKGEAPQDEINNFRNHLGFINFRLEELKNTDIRIKLRKLKKIYNETNPIFHLPEINKLVVEIIIIITYWMEKCNEE